VKILRRGLGLLCAVYLVTGMSRGAPPLPDRGGAMNSAGRRLAGVLDSMDVQHRWLPGEPVDWRTGGHDSTSIPLSGHCSAFVAAVCARFDVCILRPPEHSERLLANAQCKWLRDEGPAQGWRPVADGVEAQQLANLGEIVVACWQSPDEDDAGHIAVVRPSGKGNARVAREGPDVAQAGARNYNRTSVRHGFRFHSRAWKGGEIRYYAHRGR
jgi:hypothetical protein